MIHAAGLRYEDLDSAFWDKLFANGWALNECPFPGLDLSAPDLVDHVPGADNSHLAR